MSEKEPLVVLFVPRSREQLRLATHFWRMHSSSFFSSWASWSWEKTLARKPSKLDSSCGSSFFSCNHSCLISLSLQEKERCGYGPAEQGLCRAH